MRGGGGENIHIGAIPLYFILTLEPSRKARTEKERQNGKYTYWCHPTVLYSNFSKKNIKAVISKAIVIRTNLYGESLISILDWILHCTLLLYYA